MQPVRAGARGRSSASHAPADRPGDRASWEESDGLSLAERLDGLSLDGPRLLARRAAEAQVAQLQSCLDAAPDYFVETEGRAADPDAAARLIADAEADPQRRVFLLEARRGGAAMGLLDLMADYPEPGVAHVVLLLLRDGCRGMGYGREVMEALEAALAIAGCSAVRLSVVDENVGAHAFWTRLGYGAAGRLDGGVTVYEKGL
jgi:ribosomal protein S18 acetylase RimI-like enzyme